MEITSWKLYELIRNGAFSYYRITDNNGKVSWRKSGDISTRINDVKSKLLEKKYQLITKSLKNENK